MQHLPHLPVEEEGRLLDQVYLSPQPHELMLLNQL